MRDSMLFRDFFRIFPGNKRAAFLRLVVRKRQSSVSAKSLRLPIWRMAGWFPAGFTKEEG